MIPAQRQNRGSRICVYHPPFPARTEGWSFVVPLIDLPGYYSVHREAILSRIDAVLQGMRLFLGPETQALESEFAAMTGAAHAISVGSGTDALLLALQACGIGPGDEVITSAFTFFATVEAILLTGARAVFADIERDTFCLDPVAVETAITPRTRAVLPVHVFGRAARMDAIGEVARRHGLMIIEDACQAHGARYRDQGCGTLGRAGCFSFYCTKNLGAFGEGGMVTTNDPAVAEAVQAARNHGYAADRSRHLTVGRNSRLDEIQAAILRYKLQGLEEANALRRTKAAAYRAALADCPLEFPEDPPDGEHVYHLFVVRAPERDALASWLGREGIATARHYAVPCHRQPALADCAEARVSLPATEAAAEEVLALPFFPEITAAQIEQVADAVRRFYRDGGRRGHA